MSPPSSSLYFYLQQNYYIFGVFFLFADLMNQFISNFSINFSENFGIDRAAEMKFTAIAASLLAAASTDNGNVDEKERKLNEMIMELQLLKEGLSIRRVSCQFYQFYYCLPIIINIHTRQHSIHSHGIHIEFSPYEIQNNKMENFVKLYYDVIRSSHTVTHSHTHKHNLHKVLELCIVFWKARVPFIIHMKMCVLSWKTSHKKQHFRSSFFCKYVIIMENFACICFHLFVNLVVCACVSVFCSQHRILM